MTHRFLNPDGLLPGRGFSHVAVPAAILSEAVYVVVHGEAPVVVQPGGEEPVDERAGLDARATFLEGAAHADDLGQPSGGLHGLGDVAAHVEMAQLVAFPGVGIAPPQLDHGHPPSGQTAKG
jgi:hypothetical protein